MSDIYSLIHLVGISVKIPQHSNEVPKTPGRKASDIQIGQSGIESTRAPEPYKKSLNLLANRFAQYYGVS